eukprot:scaffold19923_cov107-Isochrysis_galbana.AAC.9
MSEKRKPAQRAKYPFPGTLKGLCGTRWKRGSGGNMGNATLARQDDGACAAAKARGGHTSNVPMPAPQPHHRTRKMAQIFCKVTGSSLTDTSSFSNGLRQSLIMSKKINGKMMPPAPTATAYEVNLSAVIPTHEVRSTTRLAAAVTQTPQTNVATR